MWLVSEERINEIHYTDLLYGDTNLARLKVAVVIIGWGWSKMVMAFYVMGL